MLTQFKSDFMQEMMQRGVFNQCTDTDVLDERLSTSVVTAYAGFDATADSLHIGHLVTLMTMRRFAAAGHKIIALIGGATSRVGDPSFRSSTRPMMDDATINANIQGISANIKAVLGPFADNVIFVDNTEWLGGVGFLDFMLNVGSHFTVSRMLAMESVKSRLDGGSSLSALEFSYMMLQAADFLELARRHGCTLQLGGSDQWGNIINGIELARRSDGRQLFGLTTKLLTTADGQKMGKTADGAIWLSPEKLSAFDFWQFWRNTDDADLERFLLMFTDLTMDEIDKLISSQENINQSKAVLASSITRIVHGDAATEDAERQARALFNGDAIADVIEIEAEGCDKGLLETLVFLGLTQSNTAARKLIEGNGVKLNGVTVEDSQLRLSPSPEVIFISVGKRKRVAIRIK